MLLFDLLRVILVSLPSTDNEILSGCPVLGFPSIQGNSLVSSAFTIILSRRVYLERGK